jgi:putative YhbY family RNA-binding protein
MPAMALTEKQLRFLRGKAHALRPVVMLGNKGLTDNVVAETAQALRDHELIKVFQGAGFQELVGAARRQFKSVRFIKPAASRARGAETGPVATGLRLV